MKIWKGDESWRDDISDLPYLLRVSFLYVLMYNFVRGDE